MAVTYKEKCKQNTLLVENSDRVQGTLGLGLRLQVNPHRVVFIDETCEGHP